MNAIKSRIAPTPSGFLHLGNLASFLLTSLWMKKLDGSLLLRIDDLDTDRCRDEYIADIFQSLNALQIHWQQGPVDEKDFTKNWSQQFRINTYRQTLSQLKTTGLVYACNCSRKEIQLNREHGLNTCNCRQRNISLDTPNMNWRIHVPENSEVILFDERIGNSSLNVHELIGDFVIRQKNGMPSYHVASLTDDVSFGMTHVVRGMDLLPSTAAQLYLAELLQNSGFKNICWLHHPLLTNAEGEKISKSAGHHADSLLQLLQHDSKELLRMVGLVLWPETTEDLENNLPDLFILFSSETTAWMKP